MAGYKFGWKCPNCGTELQLKMRETQTKRKCPHCGKTVTPVEIDRQTAEKKKAELMINLIMGVIVLGVIFFCCKGGQWTLNRESTPTPSPTASAIQVPANSSAIVPTSTSTPNTLDDSVNLSTPQNAVLTHFKAMNNRDVEMYIKTISRKYLQEYENIGQKVQLWEYKENKVKKHAQTVIQEMFNGWSERVNTPAVFYSSTLPLYEEKINGKRASIKAIVSQKERIIHLVKEGNDWKLEDFPTGRF